MNRQNLIFPFIMAMLTLLAAGCQKEEAMTVTLGATIEQPISGGDKAYIDGYTPCWHNGDMVYINNAAYPVVAASGSSAQIENVTASSAYRALFPASLVTPGIDISSSSSIPVTLPSVQRYELIGSHQRVDVPMGAYLTNGSTLHFFNLCSIVRVTVSNALNQELPLRHIVLEAANARLSGEGTAMVSGDSTNHIVMSSTARHAACLGFTADCPVTVPARGSKTFDIVVPAFARDNVTFTVYTTDNHYFETIKNNVSLWRNCITTVTLNVNSLTEITAAELVSGLDFNYRTPDNATAIVLEYNSNVTSGRVLSTDESPIPIYGNLDNTIWRVSTPARMINANQNCREMFSSMRWGGDEHLLHLHSIDFGEGFNTENVTDMSNMFMNCRSLTNLDLSHFNTSSVTDMSCMFWACESLTTLDVSHFNTSSVTNMSHMFFYCSELKSLDVSHFNTSNVRDMSNMFALCNTLKNLDVSGFNTGHVTNMNAMFLGCVGLTTLDVSNFNTSNTTDMAAMFAGCSGVTSLDVSNFNTSNATNMFEMFSGCSSLTSLDVSHFNTSNVTEMGRMFGGCSSLTSLNVSNFDTRNVISMGSMFEDCSGLTSLDVTNFNTSNVEDMYSLFIGCSGLTNLDLSNFNTGNVTSMFCMFSGCSGLTSLGISNFNTSSVTSMERMFEGCSNLTSLDVSHFNTSNVTDMYEMFDRCSSLTSLDVSHFITSNVTRTSYMFCGCSSLASLDVSGFSTSNVTDMGAMFAGCSSLASLNVSGFSTSNVTDMNDMFMGCSNLTSLDLSNFRTANVIGMNNMFVNCNSLTNLDLSNFDMSHLGYYYNNDPNDWTTGKEGMCAGLSTTSGHCTITCTETTQTELQNGTGLPTSVTFTWVRPSSSK